MRKHLLTGVSAAAIILGAQSVPAKAQDDWYVSLFGGGAFNEAAHSNYSDDLYEIRLKNGFTLGGAVGTHVAPGLRAEFETSYLRHKNKKTRYNNPQPWFSLSGHTSTTFLLGNLWKDFNAGPVSFYAGGGLGLALLDIEGRYFFSVTRGWDDKALAFAGQLGAGFRVPLSGNWLLDAGYRFKMAVDASLKAASFAFASSDATGTLYSHIVQLGLTYEMGGAPQITAAADTNPGAQNWYVSLFGGAAIGQTVGMDQGTIYGLRHKDGFSAGVALGTHLASGLRGEVELSYIRRQARGLTVGGTTLVTSGHLNETYLTANLWKDFHAGPVSPLYRVGGRCWSYQG